MSELPASEEAFDCPISSLLDLISAKWTVQILRELAIQTMRTRRFLVHIPGLSMKSLRQRLHVLEEAGMILRIDYEQRPLRVEYSITERGRKLFTVMESLKELASDWMPADCQCPLEAGYDVKSGNFNCPHRRQTNHRPK